MGVHIKSLRRGFRKWLVDSVTKGGGAIHKLTKQNAGQVSSDHLANAVASTRQACPDEAVLHKAGPWMDLWGAKALGSLHSLAERLAALRNKLRSQPADPPSFSGEVLAKAAKAYGGRKALGPDHFRTDELMPPRLQHKIWPTY